MSCAMSPCNSWQPHGRVLSRTLARAVSAWPRRDHVAGRMRKAFGRRCERCSRSMSKQHARRKQGESKRSRSSSLWRMDPFPPRRVSSRSFLPQLKVNHSKRWIAQRAALGLPDSAIALAERLLSAKSPGEVLTLGTKAVEALHTEVDQEQRSLRLGQIALSLQLLARQADGPRKAVILKDRRLAGMVESLKENAEELEVWILAAGSCALGRLASLSLGAAQATGPAHEALLACSQKKLSTFEVAQAALVLASLASVPERLASPVGRQLRESLVSTLELQSQELSPDACAHLAPALVKLRDQSAELAKGVAKRLGTGVSAVPPELLATAAKSLAALRQAPLQLMEATEQAMRRQIHLCTPRAVVYFASALSEGRGGVDAFKDFLMPAARSFILDFGCRDLCTLAECFVKASCSDPDFLADVAERLQRKVPEMGAHEVSVAFQVFAPVSYAVPQFFPAMAEKAKDLADELSPKQLTHTLQGLHSSRWADEQLLKALAARAQQLSHVLFGTHAVSVILALADAQHLDERLLRSLSETVLRSLDRDGWSMRSSSRSIL
ncbi:unnamed protein product [Durusdinium trenchii]|uniref:RNA-editing substrate-binding complex 6 protein domain-containing protein n=1 Tax=Durusdinium trenchii TaxID=1381693 RepID=A0ABP0JXA4_9DINO